jgi:hypothetical protein
VMHCLIPLIDKPLNPSKQRARTYFRIRRGYILNIKIASKTNGRAIAANRRFNVVSSDSSCRGPRWFPPQNGPRFCSFLHWVPAAPKRMSNFRALTLQRTPKKAATPTIPSSQAKATRRVCVRDRRRVCHRIGGRCAFARAPATTRICQRL